MVAVVAAVVAGALALAPSPVTSQQAAAPSVIALLPTRLPPATPRADSIRAMFDSLIAAELRAAGYATAPCVATEAAWRGSVDSIGGFYDRVTGAIVPERLRAACAATVARLREAHGAQALLTPVVLVHRVNTDQGVARWDGVRQRVEGAGWSTVDVLTLAVRTTDSTGAVMQCGRGGIRALVKFNAWSGARKPLPPEQYFDDHERNVAAVRRALASLVARAPVCEGQ